MLTISRQLMHCRQTVISVTISARAKGFAVAGDGHILPHWSAERILRLQTGRMKKNENIKGMDSMSITQNMSMTDTVITDIMQIMSMASMVIMEILSTADMDTMEIMRMANMDIMEIINTTGMDTMNRMEMIRIMHRTRRLRVSKFIIFPVFTFYPAAL